MRALTVFLVLSLGVALGGGIFATSLTSAVLWRSLPFDDASQLVAIQVQGQDEPSRWWSWRELESMAASPTVTPFDAMAGFTVADFNALSEPGLAPAPLLATLVSPDFFRVFRVQPALGRVPEPSTYGASGDRVVLVSHDLWQRRYHGAPDIVGRSIRLLSPEHFGGTAEAYRVIGVLPRDTWLLWTRADVVLPMQAESAHLSDASRPMFERVVGRIAPGTQISLARSSGPILLERLRNAGGVRAIALSLSSFQDTLFADLRPQLIVVLSLALVVFVLATTNVAMATAARAVEDRRDTAIRVAVGATHARLFRATLREHAVTTIFACGAGLWIAHGLMVGVASQVPQGWIARIPGGFSAFRVDARVLGWLIAAAASVMLFSSGAVHAVARRLTPWPLLSSSGADDVPRSSAWRSSLVAAQIALCSVTVVTASTLVMQLLALRGVDLGVDGTRAAIVWMNLSASAGADPAARSDYYDRILREAETVDGIESLGGIDLPFQFDWQPVRVRGEAAAEIADVPALARAATPGYLGASGIKLLDGRWVSESDRANAPAVVVVSESLARARWPNMRAIGQPLQTVTENGPAPVATVVGVVSDVRHAPHEPPDRIVYRAVAQDPPAWLYLIARARQGVPDPMPALNAAIWRVNPDQAIDGPWPVAEWIDNQTDHLQFLAVLTVALAAAGAVLAAAGVYGLTAWWVAASRRSLGVRRAIGASDGQIVLWFVGQWTRVILPGVAAGLLMQYFCTRVLVSAIAGLHAPSVSAILFGITFVAVSAVCAAAPPLKRALATDATMLMR